MIWRLAFIALLWTVVAQAANSPPYDLPITITSSSSSILPAERDASANWVMAGMQSVGGIPNRTIICATVNPRGGGLEDQTNIQNAVDACPVNQVVLLGAGTFTVPEGTFVQINKSITLRGSGPGTTIIQRTGGASIGVQNGSTPTPHILMGTDRFNNAFAVTSALTSDAVERTNSIQVASASGFSVGQFVLLDEASNLGWQPDPVYGGTVWSAPDYRITWRAHNPCQPGDNDCNGGTTPPSVPCFLGPECDHYTNEIKQIASISGNTITFDSPVTISYRVSHSAHLLSYSTPFATMVGVESLSLQNGDSANMYVKWCAYCWVKNVESSIHSNGGILVGQSFRVQLDRIYDHTGAWPFSGGAGYNFMIDEATSELLLVNSISILNDKVMVVRSAGAGSVIAYNYMDMGLCVNCSDAWVESGINGSHWLGSHHILFEGNWTFNTDGDDTWGSEPYMTWARNYSSGNRSLFHDYLNSNATVDDVNNIPGGNTPKRGLSLGFYNYFHSFIGNVVGIPGHMGGWVYTSDVCGGQAIFNLGYACAGGSGDPEVLGPPFPPLANCVSAHGDKCPAIRHGNYDYLTNAIAWDPTISNHTLPNSFYLTSAPSFFSEGSGYTWPWVNPTGSPQFLTLPAKARFDANTPFTQP